jgi:hypothetical protein
MPVNPTPRSLHVDQFLTQLSIAYRNPEYIVDDIYPVVPVRKQSDLIPSYDQSHWYRNEARVRAIGEKSQRGGFKVGSTSYYCGRFSFGFEIADEQRDNQDAPFDLDRDGTLFATDKILMAREISFATNHFTTGVWGPADKVGGTDFAKWSDYSQSMPLVNVADYRDGVEALIGREPNTMVMGKLVWLKLKWHPDLIDTIKYTQRGQLSVDLLAALMEVPKILIGRSIYTTSPEGTAEASVTYTRIWGKNALLVYVPAAPSIMTPAAGYCFSWARVPGSLQYIKRMRDEEREVDIVEANSYFTHVQTSKNAGVFLSNAVV